MSKRRRRKHKLQFERAEFFESVLMLVGPPVELHQPVDYHFASSQWVKTEGNTEEFDRFVKRFDELLISIGGRGRDSAMWRSRYRRWWAARNLPKKHLTEGLCT